MQNARIFKRRNRAKAQRWWGEQVHGGRLWPWASFCGTIITSERGSRPLRSAPQSLSPESFRPGAIEHLLHNYTRGGTFRIVPWSPRKPQPPENALWQICFDEKEAWFCTSLFPEVIPTSCSTAGAPGVPRTLTWGASTNIWFTFSLKMAQRCTSSLHWKHLQTRK